MPAAFGAALRVRPKAGHDGEGGTSDDWKSRDLRHRLQTRKRNAAAGEGSRAWSDLLVFQTIRSG